MSKGITIGILLLFMSLVGCGPDTIFLRPNLDTPDHHIANGHALLNQGKTMDACREFRRAHELDPENIEALVGLAVALGRTGDVEQGLKILEKAEQLATMETDRKIIEKGYEQLKKIPPR